MKYDEIEARCPKCGSEDLQSVETVTQCGFFDKIIRYEDGDDHAEFYDSRLQDGTDELKGYECRDCRYESASLSDFVPPAETGA